MPSHGEGRNPVHNVDEGILRDGDDRAEYIGKGVEELKVIFALWPKIFNTETNGFTSTELGVDIRLHARVYKRSNSESIVRYSGKY